MSLPATCIRRPILAWMLNLVLVVFGLVSLFRLPVRELPDIDPPVVNVTAIYPGASAEVVETEVVELLEEAINGVPGIKTLTSQSRSQVGSITVEFDLSRPIEIAAQDVRDRVARVRGELPRDLLEPIVAKQDANANPILWIALFSERLSTLDLTTLAENRIKNQIESLDGVGSVILGGSKRYAVRVRLDPDRLASRGVTVLDVDRALAEQNVELPGGIVEGVDRELAIETRTALTTPAEFERIVVRREGDALVRLGEVGRIEVGVEDEKSIARYNGKPAMGIGVVRQSKADTVAVATAVKKVMAEIAPTLPAGVEWFVAYDESTFVEDAIREVWITLGVSFLLVVGIIFVFLRSWRATLVPVLAIPICVACTFSILQFFGFSVNILTMLALVLAIGVVVDDAIVVLENIFRHIEEGKAPLAAAFAAMDEIVFAVIATTVSLVAVFVPLAFQKSITGRLLIEFAIALAGSVAVSGFVALTLTPALASRFLRSRDAEQASARHGRFDRFLDGLSGRYVSKLAWCLDHPWRVLLAAAFAVGLGVAAFSALESDFLPEEDKGRLLCLVISPEGSTSSYTDGMVKQAEAIMAEVPEAAGYFSAVALGFAGPGNPAQGLMFVRFAEERERGLSDILQGPTGLGGRFFTEIEGALAFPIVPKAIQRSFGQPFQLVLSHPDLAELDQFSQSFAQTLRGAGFLANVRPGFAIDKPELEVRVDRDRAAALGIPISDVSRSLQVLFGGSDLSHLKIEGKEYDVIVQFAPEHRAAPADVDRVTVRSASGELVRLSDLVERKATAGPSSISHYGRRRSATIEATPLGIPLGVAVKQTEALLAEHLPPGFDYQWAGEARDLRETSGEALFVVLLAVLIVYMTLAAQFESLRDPFTVLLAMPLGVIGAAGGLYLLGWVDKLGHILYAAANYAPDAGAFTKFLSAVIPRIPAMNVNMFSLIGGILLIGLVTKNSILLVEFANQARERGLAAKAAMLEAGRIRLRPILMTALSTVVGTLPIAIGFGAGAESRRPLGVAAVGGMMSSTFLTLFVIPVVYVLLERGSHRRAIDTAPPA